METTSRIKLSHTQVIGGGYLALIAIGALLLMLPFASRSGAAGPVLALFTAASATCLTGITLVDTWSQWSPFGQLVILLLIQIGGLGFMTIATQILMLMRRKIGLRERTVLTESLSLNQLGGILNMTRMIVGVTLVTEAVGALLLSLYFVPRAGLARGLWFGLFHSVSAFCNAGFDLTGYFAPDSSLLLLADKPLPLITMMLLSVIGGLGFIIWDDMLTFRGNLKKYHLHSKLALTMSAVLLAVGFFAYLIFEAPAAAAGMPLPQRLLTAAFTSVTVRTTGFQVLPLAEMSSSGRLITIILMFIGGNPGSMAGGVKTIALAVLLVGSWSMLRGRRSAQMFGRRLEADALPRSCAILMFNMMIGLGAAMLLCILPHVDVEMALFEAFSALSTTGITFGVCTTLPWWGQLLMASLFYCGRVGNMVFAAALVETKTPPLVNNPVEKISIG